MSKSPQPKELEHPLYVRWTPDNCPYALEMRLDLVGLLSAALQNSEQSGAEIGGVFTGVFPSPDSPILRLNDVLLVPGDGGGGQVDLSPEYGSDAAQIRRVAEISAQLRQTEQPVVASFRSHRRESPLAPSDFDRTMLMHQFPEGIYALLLIAFQAPRQGVFYLAAGGQLSEVPSTPAFSLEEDTFRSLPELPLQAAADLRTAGTARQKARQRPVPWAAVASLAVLMLLVGTWTFGSHISQWFRPTSNQIDLTVMSAGPSLKITWDHSAPAVSNALGATIVILDGPSHREVHLDSDDLRLGQVAYERVSRKVYVVMRLDSPGVKLPPQTFDWSGD